jgi:hypothetical protein
MAAVLGEPVVGAAALAETACGSPSELPIALPESEEEALQPVEAR